MDEACTHCQGHGNIIVDWKKYRAIECSHCQGLGLVIPKIDEIARLRLALEQISRKQKLDACAAASMQAIATAALSVSSGVRQMNKG